MIEKQLHRLSPTKLRLTLFCTMGVMLILCGVGFWFFHNGMAKYAERISTDNATATASNEDIARLKRLETELRDNEVAVTRAKNIVADSQFYQYQTQIIDDLKRYAKQANVSITSFTFNNENASKAAKSSTGSGAAPLTIAGLKTTSISINITNPVKYKSFMQFLRAIELNLTKMEISGISLTRTENSENLTVSPLNIEVYTR